MKRARNIPMDGIRMLPASPEAEKGLIGSILKDPLRVFGICEDRQMTPEWFHVPTHRAVYELLEKMHRAKQPIDLVSLTNHLRNLDLLESVGGPAEVTQMFTYLPTAANAGYYANILAEKYAARRLIHVCTEIASRAYDEQDQIGDLVDEAQVSILAVDRPDSAGTETIQHVRPAVIAAVNGIQEIYEHRGGVVGLPTGYHQLDRMTGGLRGPQLVIIAGRPSMGKSALLMNMAEYMAVAVKKKVLVFSLEMSALELAQRLVCGRANINVQRVRDGFLSRVQLEGSLPEAATTIANTEIYIDDTAGLSIQEVRVRTRRFVKAHPDTAAVFGDYLQLLRSNSPRAKENRALEIAEISGGLKALAKELNRPQIWGAQLNRDNDGANAKPKLSNLRESGSIEQDADVALLLHRRWYYTKADEDKGKASVDLAKQRNGPTGEIALTFNDQLARFENPAGQDLYSNNPEHRQGYHPDEED